MSHQSKTSSIPLKEEFWKRTSNLTNSLSGYSRVMVKNSNWKSGFVILKVSKVLYSAPLCVTMMYTGLTLRAGRHESLIHFPFSRFMLTMVVDAAFRVPCPL